MRGIAAIAIGASATVGVVETARWARKSALFAISRVEVAGALRARPDAVRRLSGVAVGTNLFAVDVAAARSRVTSHPWVRQANVRLTAIDRVIVTVVEHEPVALVALGNLYFVDNEGRVFKRYTPDDAAALPVVTGLNRERVEAEDAQQLEMLRSAIALVEAWLPDDLGVLSEVNVDDARGLTAVTAQDGLLVALGREGWQDRLPKLRRILNTLEEKGLRAQRIDLSGRRRVDRAVVQLASTGGIDGDV